MELHHFDATVVFKTHNRKGEAFRNKRLSDTGRPLQNEIFLVTPHSAHALKIFARYEKVPQGSVQIERLSLRRWRRRWFSTSNFLDSF